MLRAVVVGATEEVRRSCKLLPTKLQTTTVRVASSYQQSCKGLHGSCQRPPQELQASCYSTPRRPSSPAKVVAHGRAAPASSLCFVRSNGVLVGDVLQAGGLCCKELPPGGRRSKELPPGSRRRPQLTAELRVGSNGSGGGGFFPILQRMLGVIQKKSWTTMGLFANCCQVFFYLVVPIFLLPTALWYGWVYAMDTEPYYSVAIDFVSSLDPATDLGHRPALDPEFKLTTRVASCRFWAGRCIERGMYSRCPTAASRSLLA